jgi:threonine dehydrogenase-like Zn-dependent dehydrogenase
MVDASLPAKEFANAVQDISRQHGADIVLELAGENSATQRAIGSTRPGGQCLLSGRYILRSLSLFR